MLLEAKGICVDSGMIVVSDLINFRPYLNQKKQRSRNIGLLKLFKIPKGKYFVDWRIKNSHNGTIEGAECLVIKSGKVVITDPCYLVASDKWDLWMDNTNMGERNPGAFVLNEMGGDGCYNVELKLEK